MWTNNNKKNHCKTIKKIPWGLFWFFGL
jgi:hypothetical protein